MKRWIAILSVFIAGPALAVPCQTEREARADALIGFFTAQAVAALLCEDRLGMEGLVELRLQVRTRYRERIDQAAQVREDYFARAYGKSWKKDIVEVNRVFVTELMNNIHPSVDLCIDLEADLQRQLEQGWPYVAAQAEEGFLQERMTGSGRLCRAM